MYWETPTGIVHEDEVAERRIVARRLARGPEKTTSAYPELIALFRLAHHYSRFPDTKPTPLDWMGLTEAYLRCDLTKERYKLVAISGMARKVQAATGQAWCAEMWSDRICRQLLWLQTENTLYQPITQRAPSWSWAAFEGPIQYPNEAGAAKFVARCHFVHLLDEAGKQSTWLNGLRKLVLRGRLVALAQLYASDIAFVQIGPGPMRKGDPAEHARNDLPRLNLRHDTRGRCLTDHTQSKLDIIGWAALHEFWSVFEGETPTHPWSFLVLGTIDKTESK